MPNRSQCQPDNHQSCQVLLAPLAPQARIQMKVINAARHALSEISALIQAIPHWRVRPGLISPYKAKLRVLCVQKASPAQHLRPYRPDVLSANLLPLMVLKPAQIAQSGIRVLIQHRLLLLVALPITPPQLQRCAFLARLVMNALQIEERPLHVEQVSIPLRKTESAKSVQLDSTVLLSRTIQCLVNTGTQQTVYLDRLIARNALQTKIVQIQLLSQQIAQPAPTRGSGLHNAYHARLVTGATQPQQTRQQSAWKAKL